MAPKKKAAAKPLVASPAKEEKKVEAAAEKRRADSDRKETEPPNKIAKIEDGSSLDGISRTVGFNTRDLTLNVIPTMGGKVLKALTEGGMQYLIAGARVNTGIRAGCYMFEAKVLEALNPAEATTTAPRTRLASPRQLLRIGFSTANSSLILGDAEEQVFFDSEGNFCSGKTDKVQVGALRFVRDQVIGVVLDLNPNSEHPNTISLYREGERMSEPRPLPEHLIGKTLFPHVSFRNATLQVGLGKQPLKALSPPCRSLGAAANADVEFNKEVLPLDGKYEVVFPVAFPDEGTFDWLDYFLEKNPHFVELSDRKVLEWAASSGLMLPKSAGRKSSNDKPAFNFGLPGMDDFSIRRVLRSIAPAVPRNYVVMEVRDNLIESERKATMKRFGAAHFKRVANVVMGAPTQEFTGHMLDRMLKEKQENARAEWEANKAEEKRKKDLENRHKALAEIRRKAAEEARKKTEGVRRRAMAALRRAEAKKRAEAAGEEYVSEGETEIEQSAGDMAVEEEAKEEEAEEMDEDPPRVDLTAEELKLKFRPPSGDCPDLTEVVMNQSFGQFTVPNFSEGFDDIRYEWNDAGTSKEYLKNWILHRKKTSRIEDLQPGQWFQDQMKEWQKAFRECQVKQKAFSMARKAKPPAEESFEVELDSAADINDTGNGEPIYKDWSFEDWALLQIRYELYVLQIAFKSDVDDAERDSIQEKHLSFYYTKYFRKQLVPKSFAVTSLAEIVDLVQDCIGFEEDGEMKVLTTTLPPDMDSYLPFFKLAEESRRERQRRIDAGDETARIKFIPSAIQVPVMPKATGPVNWGPKAPSVAPSPALMRGGGLARRW